LGWRSRIVGHDRVNPQDLTGHPLNHRVHPQAQRDVVRDSIAQFGFVKSVLVNRKTGYIIDGHERVWQALDARESDPTVTVDVEYVDLSEDEERAVLAVLDASTEMAEVDQDKLSELLDGIAFESDAVDALIADLQKSAIAFEFEEPAADVITKNMCPNCGCEL
jgi:ParB-like chromosome segregation protein Spo0J